MAFTLKALRTNKNMNLKQGAQALGVSVDTLHNWEHGKTYPNVPQIKKIEEVYGVEYGDIIFCPRNSV